MFGLLRTKIVNWSINQLFYGREDHVVHIDEEQFVNLSKEEVMQILQCSAMDTTEKKLFDCVLQWHANNSTDSKELEQFFEMIHFPTMCASELQEIEAMKLPNLKQSLLLEAYRYISCRELFEQEKDDPLSITKEFYNIRHIDRGGLKWKLDKRYCNSALSIDGYKITYSSFHGGLHASVIGDTPLLPNSGIHRWAVVVRGTNAHWIGIGVIQKEKLTPKLDNDYNYFYGISSMNQLYRVQGIATQWNVGDVINVELDTNTGLLTIQSSNGTHATTNILKNVILYPIFNLYSNHNEIEVRGVSCKKS